MKPALLLSRNPNGNNTQISTLGRGMQIYIHNEILFIAIFHDLMELPVKKHFMNLSHKIFVIDQRPFGILS